MQAQLTDSCNFPVNQWIRQWIHCTQSLWLTLTIHGHFINLCTVILFNITQDSDVIGLDKVNCNTLATKPPWSTNPKTKSLREEWFLDIQAMPPVGHKESLGISEHVFSTAVCRDNQQSLQSKLEKQRKAWRRQRTENSNLCFDKGIRVSIKNSWPNNTKREQQIIILLCSCTTSWLDFQHSCPELLGH